MASTEPAGPSEQPGVQAVTAPRLAVVLSGPTDASRICRVNAPDRVLRIWALLTLADAELRRVRLQPGAAERLRRQLDAVTTELERSVSPALAGELHHLIRPATASMSGVTPITSPPGEPATTPPIWSAAVITR
jgi:hypothetical protein